MGVRIVAYALNHRVKYPAEVCRGEAQHHANRCAQRAGDDTDERRLPQANHHGGVEIPAEKVGAEGVL